MIKKKLIALAASVAMLSSLSAGFITTANAYDPANDGAVMAIKYDSDKSTDTTKYIDVYYAGEGIGDYKIAMSANTTEITNVTFTVADSSVLSSAMVNKEKLKTGEFVIQGGTEDADIHALADNKIGTVVITIPATVTDLEITLLANSDFTNPDWDAPSFGDGDTTNATVKAYEESVTPVDGTHKTAFTFADSQVEMAPTKTATLYIDETTNNVQTRKQADITEKLANYQGALSIAVIISGIPEGTTVDSAFVVVK